LVGQATVGSGRMTLGRNMSPPLGAPGGSHRGRGLTRCPNVARRTWCRGSRGAGAMRHRQCGLVVIYGEGVRALLHGVRHLRHQVWVDERLSGGQAWWDEILAQLRSCDAMLIAISPALLESQASALERQYAAHRGSVQCGRARPGAGGQAVRAVHGGGRDADQDAAVGRVDDGLLHPRQGKEGLASRAGTRSSRATGRAPSARPRPPAYWRLSIISFICSFLFGGIAMCFSAQVGSRWRAGNTAGAEKASKMALVWGIVGIAVGLIVFFAVIGSAESGY